MPLSVKQREIIRKRRENLLRDYATLFSKYNSHTIVVSKLAVKHKVVSNTIANDLKLLWKQQRQEENGQG